jgi:hypothetical protein
MPDRLFSAIVTEWDGDSLGSTFTGGLWFGTVPEGTSWPYVVITDLGNALRFMTSGDESNEVEFRAHAFQMSIFWKEDGVNDPVVQVGSLMRTLDSTMQSNNRTLTVPSDEGSIYDVRCTRQEIIEADEDDRVWQGQLDYSASRQRRISA